MTQLLDWTAVTLNALCILAVLYVVGCMFVAYCVLADMAVFTAFWLYGTAPAAAVLVLSYSAPVLVARRYL